jgi:UDP-N-acetylglucosamine 1-carboxyvinyltransferase
MRGSTVYFDIPSVTGTENVLMASVAAQGETIIKNAAREPEVGNLIDMLTAMGADITGKGSDLLTVRGVDRLSATEATIIPDRIETGTYMIVVAATGGAVTLTHCNPDHLPALSEKLALCGADIRTSADSITISCPENQGKSRCRLRSIDITTLPYPGFPTDLQAQFMALMAQGDGTSIIHETIFENRFMHVPELKRMGADISIEGSRAVVRGVGRDVLNGAPVMATDLRASASLVIAGLAATGITEVSRIYHLERGYEDMVGKLQGLGAKVHKVRA